ncbi:MAG TPA: Gfo/Idh/MocA family oxidoreductase [Propionibacteriaceae bacterium]|nr:Gfo/Idh/MocA family oxidoreductase [Propionibacteriaceae bacterium]
MSTIKVGVLGGGGILDAHIRGYRAYANAIEVVAVADVVEETARRRAAELDAATYTDFRQMILEADLDAVDICLPHYLHAEAIVAAAQAGKHILCEKPLCLTVLQADEVQQAVSTAGVTLMCAHNQLYLPAVAKAKQLLDQGILGTVYEVRTTDSFYNDFDPQNMGWRASAATSGGGELMDTGYHPTYLMLHLAGGSPVEATALLSRHRLRFMEGEDSAQVLVRFENGVVGQLVTSWAYDPPPGTQRFSVVGELGSLRSDGRSLTVTLRGSSSQTYDFEDVDTYAYEIGQFADCLRSGIRPLHTEKEGIDVLCLILAAYEGARSRTIAPVFRGSEL